MKKIVQVLAFSTVLTLVLASFASAQTSQTFNLSLGYGSNQKTEVLKLQEFLVSNGYLHVTPTGLFLSLTKKAVADFQKDNNVSPAVGYFGPLTRAVANNKMAMVTTPAKVTIHSVVNTGGLATAVLSNSKIVNWYSNNYPQSVGVNINLLRKTSDTPRSFTFIRTIAKDTSNDGQEIFFLGNGEMGDDIYIEVTCSGTYQFKNGCKFGAEPIKVN